MNAPPRSRSLVGRRGNLHPRTAIPFVLLAVFAMQSFWFIQTQSLTYDEPAHIIAGVDAWRNVHPDQAPEYAAKQAVSVILAANVELKVEQ